MVFFNDIQSEVKNTLFRQYCTSFYGYQACAFYTRDINDLYIVWQKAVRRIWKLPNMTHCRLLPHITGLWPSKIMFYKMYMKHFLSGIASSNSIVNTVFRCSLYNISRMGNNVKQMCMENGIDVWNLKEGDELEVASKMVKQWINEVCEEDVRVGKQIRELCQERDNVQEWLLERQDICDIISILCTM